MAKIQTHKHTLNLRAGDYERLKEVFDEKNIPAAVVIRHLVSKFVDQLTPRTADSELMHIEGDLDD